MTTSFDIAQLYRFGPKEKVSGLDQTFAQRLHALLSAAPGDVSIYSGYRSPQRQAEILRAGLAKRGLPTSRWDDYVSQAGGDVVKAGDLARPWLRSTGITKWIAPPGSSFHQRGQAADLRYASDDVRSWVHANAPKHGLHFPMAHEPWHIEPVGSRSRGAFAAKALEESNTPTSFNSDAPSSDQPEVPASAEGPPPPSATDNRNLIGYDPRTGAPIYEDPAVAMQRSLDAELAADARAAVSNLKPSMSRGFIGAFFG